MFRMITITVPMTLLVLGDNCPELKGRRLRTRIVMGGGQGRVRIKRTTTLTPSSRSRRKGLRRGPEGLVGRRRINPLIRQIF